MKTKCNFAMFVATCVLLATSCSNEEVLKMSDNEAALVTFSIGLENGMNSRAISDGTGINKLIYAVFDSEGNRVITSDQAAEFTPEKTFYLLKGEKYTAVFWAQNKTCEAYSISEDYKTITINYDGALNNDETRDAFFRSETFIATEGSNINVILKRPFAQLNLGITETEWQNAKNVGFEIAQTSVEIKQVATTLNLIDGYVGGGKDITFTSNFIPSNDRLLVDINCDGEKEVYKYLSMCYFLANNTSNGASQTTLDALKFTLISADGSKTVVLQDGLANAPVQRNYRTNIVGYGGGSILTSDIDMDVSLDPLYDGENTLDDSNTWEEYAGIYTEEALAGKTILIPSDWHIRNGYIIEPIPENWTASSSPVYTKAYTIDGNGNTVSFEPYGYSFLKKNVFAAADGELVTVKNISFAGEYFGTYGGVYGGVAGRTAYNTLLENVKMIDNGIYCYNDAGSIPMSAFSNLGTATLDNCTITGTYWVGAKDENPNAQACYDNYGIYDIFVPNNNLTHLKNSTVGTIYVNNHGQLKVEGTSVIDRIDVPSAVKAVITIESGAKVKLFNVDQYSPSFTPNINIKAGAIIETLDLHSITIKTDPPKLIIHPDANITKIIHNGNEYTSVADFLAFLASL